MRKALAGFVTMIAAVAVVALGGAVGIPAVTIVGVAMLVAGFFVSLSGLV